MLASRSAGIVENVCEAGSVRPTAAACRTGRAGSPRSTRRSATGAGTGRSRPSGTPRSPCWSPAPSPPREGSGSGLLVELDRADLAGRDPRHLELGVDHQAERVVELELVGRVARPAEKPPVITTKAPMTSRRRRRRGSVTHRSVPGRRLARVAGVALLRVVDPAPLHRAGAAVALARGQQALARCSSRPERAAAAEREHVRSTGSRNEGRRFSAPFSTEPTPMTGATRLELPLASVVARMAEALEPAGQVDGVRAGGGELGGRVVERDRRLREGAEPLLAVGRQRAVARARAGLVPQVTLASWTLSSSS